MSESTTLRDGVESNNTTDTDATGDISPVQLSDDVTVIDAYVDWSINYANKPQLVVITDTLLSTAFGEPFAGAYERDIWIAENEYGVLSGVQRSQPLSDDTGAHLDPQSFTHISGQTDKRYWALPHVVKAEHNSRFIDTVLEVRVASNRSAGGSSTPVRVETAEEIIAKYINGPQGTDNASYWYMEHREHSSAYESRSDKFSGYVSPSVSLVTDDIHTWIPRREQDVEDSDTTFDEFIHE